MFFTPQDENEGFGALTPAQKNAANNALLAKLKNPVINTGLRSLVLAGTLTDALGLFGKVVTVSQVKDSVLTIFRGNGWLIEDLDIEFYDDEDRYRYRLACKVYGIYSNKEVIDSAVSTFHKVTVAGKKAFDRVAVGVATEQKIIVRQPVTGKGSGVTGLINDISTDGLIPTAANVTSEVLLGEPVDFLGMKIPKYVLYGGAALVVYKVINRR